eukprot:snap_masked-scaffold_11-processed-gene-1.21-mRNA-1 protein AED:1.00 eAED:1.00 QI:0/-1/0/0/-1/1/1/0/315
MKESISKYEIPFTDLEGIASGYKFKPVAEPIVQTDVFNQLILPSTNGSVVETVPPVKKKARLDLDTGSYRSRLKYTLFQKHTYLQQKVMEFERTTTIEEKAASFNSHRLATNGVSKRKSSKKYIAGYSYKAAVGLLAASSLVLRKGCCTLPQAIDRYVNACNTTKTLLNITGPPVRKESNLSKLRKFITEQLPVIRISGKEFNLFYIDGKQHRQTYLLFPNILNTYVPDSQVVSVINKLIHKRLSLNSKHSLPGNSGISYTSGSNKVLLEAFDEKELQVIEGCYGSMSSGLVTFCDIEPQYREFYMEHNEECVLI